MSDAVCAHSQKSLGVWLVSGFLPSLLVLAGGPLLLAQPPGLTDLRILPQIFHIDEGNSSRIYIQNVTSETIAVGIEFFAQDGTFVCVPELECPVISREIPPLGTLAFSEMPSPFVGSAVLFCSASCVATASWRFSLSAGERFDVGVVPQLFSSRSTAWGSPILPIRPDSAYGLSVFNSEPEEATCTFEFREVGGQEVGSEELVVEGHGQIAQFAQAIAAGFSGTVEVQCDREVIVIGLVQDLTTGFPTNLNYSPLIAPGAGSDPLQK